LAIVTFAFVYAKAKAVMMEAREVIKFDILR
jgi:hypothetical protein